MGANTFGHLFQIQTFGESHGPAMGVVIDGCPAGVPFDFPLLQRQLDLRRPGQSSAVSARHELDQAEILSGVFEGKTLGTPIAVVVKNSDARSEDYHTLKDRPRAGHADDVWLQKFGHRDFRGGGRSSGRETLCRVIGGAVAQMLIRSIHPETRVQAWVSSLGPHTLTEPERLAFLQKRQEAYDFPLRFPSERALAIEQELLAIKEQGDSWGGIAEIHIEAAPKSLGQPVFHKLKADLAQGLMSVGAVAGIELGQGLHQKDRTGQSFHQSGDSAVYGGIRGGISTGENISLKVHMKPTSSIMDVAKKGRHDPSILIRAIPVMEAMVNLVLADHILWRRLDRY